MQHKKRRAPARAPIREAEISTDEASQNTTPQPARQDWREIFRAEDPELAQWVQGLWATDEERAAYLREANRAALKAGHFPRVAGDRKTRTALYGLAETLIQKGVSPLLTVQLADAVNEAQSLDPLDREEVRAIVGRAAEAELSRRAAA